MYYTQFLRVANGLKWLAIALTALLALIVTIAGVNGAFSEPVHGSPDHGGAPLPVLFGAAGFIAACFASRFARSLSEENEAHLPVVWTTPASRSAYALAVIGVDVLGILAAFGLTLLAMASLIAIFGVARFIEVTPDSGVQLVRYLALPLAYYGIMMALTASLGKAGRGVIGFAWVGSAILSLLAASAFPPPWKTLFALLNTINPIAYAGYTHSVGHDTVNMFSNTSQYASLAVTTDIAALIVLCVVGLLAGVLQWRRLEA